MARAVGIGFFGMILIWTGLAACGRGGLDWDPLERGGGHHVRGSAVNLRWRPFVRPAHMEAVLDGCAASPP